MTKEEMCQIIRENIYILYPAYTHPIEEIEIGGIEDTVDVIMEKLRKENLRRKYFLIQR